MSTEGPGEKVFHITHIALQWLPVYIFNQTHLHYANDVLITFTKYVMCAVVNSHFIYNLFIYLVELIYTA